MKNTLSPLWQDMNAEVKHKQIKKHICQFDNTSTAQRSEVQDTENTSKQRNAATDRQQQQN